MLVLAWLLFAVLLSLNLVEGLWVRTKLVAKVGSKEYRVARSATNSRTIVTQENKYRYNVATKSLYEFLRVQSLESLASAEEAKQIIREIRASEELLNTGYAQYSSLWDLVIRQVGGDNRTLEEVLGKDVSERLLNSVEAIDVYEPSAVRTFLSNPVFESMLGGILYEGIFEFIQKVDILGNIINKMPIIGPIRQAIVSELKNNLDRTLGVQVKTFLSSFNKIAVQRMAEFILSPQNRVAFRAANRNIVSYLLKRKVSSLVSFVISGNASNSGRLKVQVWNTILLTPQEEVEQVLDYLYDKIATIKWGTVINIEYEDIITASPTIEHIVVRTFEEFMRSTQGKAFVESLSAVEKK